MADSKVSPSKEKKRNKYAGVQSRVVSGLPTSLKPPVPNFAANRVKRENEQQKADRLAPSKWLAQLIRSHWVRFSERTVQNETPKRVQALTRMRKEMQRRYMLLYRHFRRRKYGEPIPKTRGFQNNDELEDMFKDDEAMLEKIQNLMNKRFDNMEAIAEAKKSDEVDQISDFGSDEDRE